MKSMNMKEKRNTKLIRRAASALMALAMLVNETYVWNILDELSDDITAPTIMRANAAEETPTFTNYTNPETKEISIPIEDFVEYSVDCQNNPQSHQNDKITIKSTGVTDHFESGFAGLGTENFPFAGSIKISAGNTIPLNLDAPLFNCVYDNVVLNDNNPLIISRGYEDGLGTDEATPVIAKKVVDASGTATWKINFISPSDSKTHYLGSFGGFIGRMTEGTIVDLNVTMDTTEDDKHGVAVNGSDDLGLACGHMEQGAELTFEYHASRDLLNIATSGGDVGGLVGEMESGSIFTLKNEEAVTSGIEITTSAGDSYAGGIVGRNFGGTVTVYDTVSAAAVYPVTQNITGTSGAGGVYGFYRPAYALVPPADSETSETEDKSFLTTNYSINCQVNGTGYTGGLFGVLDVTEDVTISGSSTVTSNHASGDCTAYGGLIGQYKADSVNRTLTVSSATAVPFKPGGATYYGGGIGEIEKTVPTYVEFSSFTANASNAGALTFGGLVANADNAFVKASGVSVSANGYKGGGLVGTLANGVLQISGENTITGSSANPGDGENLKVGKIVGYRNNGLVFMDTGASWSAGAADVDDIGAWGGVINLNGFATPANVLSVSGHAVTIGTNDYGFTSIANNEQFAVTALRFQIDEGTAGNQFVSFANDSVNSTTIASSDINLTGTVTLTDTGVYGLTRDNDISSDGSMVKCVYGGTFGNATTAQTITYDTGTIYRHKYNGLFAKLDGGVVRNVNFGGTINVNAKTDMYVGTAAARATGDFSASNVIVSAAMTYSGGSKLYLGGILGEADTEIGTIDVSDCTVNANITGSNENAGLGGVIGQISHSADETRAWGFNTVNVSGKIGNTASGKLGGLVGVITGNYNGNTNNRVLTLNGVTVSGLEVSGSGSEMGGLLGYSWLKTDVNVTDVTIQNNSSKKSTISNSDSGGIGGMVYRATGKWTVTSLDIQDIKITGTGSVGMIVNKGISHDDGNLYSAGNRSAIYLCLPSGHTYNITSADLPSVSVFDELCAYTASDADNVLRNGNGIISINTTFKTDGSTASGSYHAQTANGASANPNSRYYYNLDTVTSNSASSTILTYDETNNPNAYKNQLMSWGLNQYACANIKKNFADPFGATIANQEYDMNDYSWYPVDLDKNITVNGTFKFYSHEFELGEDAKKSAEAKNSYDRTNLEKNQHYTMHCGLFRNISSGKTLTVGTTVFRGDVGLLDGGSGALICGTAQGALSTSKAVVKVTGSVLLDGVYVFGVDVDAEDPNYAPLLINKVGNYADLEIANVSSSDKYLTNANVPYIAKSGTYPKAGSNLIGDVGLSDAPTGINVSFKNIKLDGRTANVSDTDFNAELDAVYGTQRTLFNRSTLLNQFKYVSGSTGKYDYTSSEDWNNGHHYIEDSSQNKTYIGVTYGKEVGYTDYDTHTEYGGKEQKYSGSIYYTNPVVPAAESAYAGFGNFIPYVYTAYNKNNNTHQLRVNHAASTATGCGTYNDPYILSDGSKLEAFSYWINTGFVNGDKISIPTANLSNTAILGTWCANKSAHVEMTYNGTNFTGTVDSTNYTISADTMRTYLAGAYYQIPDEIDRITIPSSSNPEHSFTGLGNTVDNLAVFRGVIDGNDRKIVNNTVYPLIESSNGAVVKDLTIEATPNNNIQLTGTNNQAFDSLRGDGRSNNAAYGAVIAKTLGGDNIIDNVSVSLGTESNKLNIAFTGNYAQLVPVGGYVGVVVNGGLIFRHMPRVDDNNNALTYDEGLFANVTIDATSTSAFATNDSTAISDSNKAWLYVNPIVGRVINGYAVTESDKYRPYEDGTRTYQGGTTDEVRYWDENEQKEVTEEPETLSHVTMQNGTKHYSIADIDINLPKLSFDSNDKTKPLVANGQSLFLMSVMVNSGLAKQSLGYRQAFQVSRWANYDNIGTDNSSVSDYNSYAKNDMIGTDTYTVYNHVGYLGNFYTINGELARDMANQVSTLTLSTENGTYYLPDGYKGLGNIFQNSDNYRMKISTLNGNGATISQNTEFYYYFKKNGDNSYVFDEAKSGDNYIYTPNTNVGIGFINYQNQALVANDLMFTGNVIVDAIDSTSPSGAHCYYFASCKAWGDMSNGSGDGIDRQQMASVGSFIGLSSVDTLTLNNVGLNNIYVHGLKASGGLIGGNQGGDKNVNPTSLTIINTTAESKKIKVHGASVTGGFLGRNNRGDLTIDLYGNQYDITEIVCECEKEVETSQEHDSNYGVGGLIGCTRSRIEDGDNGTGLLTLKNINIGDAEQTSATVVKCDGAPIFTGGLVGLIDRSSFEINNCHVYNLDLSSVYYAGGVVGHVSTSPNYVSTNDTSSLLMKNVTLEKSKRYALVPTIISTGNSTGGFIGAGKQDLKKNLYMNNCSISDYLISSSIYAGGITGVWGYVSDNTKVDVHSSLVLQNFMISDCTIKADSAVGGLIGLINKDTQTSNKMKNATNNQYLLGYNVLEKNLRLDAYTEGGTPTNAGYICGINQKAIKIAGFSRQDSQTESTMIAELVGNCTSSNTNKFGSYGQNNSNVTDGYVVFADYQDKASSDKNAEHANLVVCDEDVLEVTVIGSKTTVKTYDIIAQKDENNNSIIKKVTPVGKAVGTPSDTPVEGLPPGQKRITSTGTKKSYENLNELVPVTDISSQLLAAGEETGFYIRTADGKYLTSKFKYSGSDHNYLLTTTNINDAALWYLEPTNGKYWTYDWSTKTATENDYSNGTLDGYRIYTNCTINNPENDNVLSSDNSAYYPDVYNDATTEQKRYLSHRGGQAKYVNLYTMLGFKAAAHYQYAKNWGGWNGAGSSKNKQWDCDFSITQNTTGTNSYTISLTNNSNSATYINPAVDNNGFYFTNSAAIALEFYTPPEGEKFYSSDYDATSFTPTAGSTIAGSSSNYVEATSQQLSDYEATLEEFDDDFDTSDHSYEIYTITQTVVENVYDYDKNKSPYVTTNPKRFITDEQFLTGDGVSSYNYASTAFKSIIDDQKNESAKAYTICPTQLGLTENAEALSNLRKELSTSYAEFRSYINANGNQGMKNFPLFVAEDTTEATLTALINNYLQTLTNTNFNYADTTKTNIYEVGLYKCVFDPGSGEFVVDTGSSNLKRKSPGGEYYFYMEAKDVDTQDVPQFTLMDIKFKDPSDASKIVYHLFVPVYVKKVLRFDFNAHIKSGTDYYWTAYDKVSNLRNQGLFENLGNSISIAFEWDYDRSAKEWADAVNGGDSLLTNYCKSFMLKRHNDTGDTDWAANTKMILVDANRQGKMYYLDDPPSTTSLGTLFSLYDFTDSEGEHYKPVDFIDLMTVTVEQSDDGSLTTEGATDANATVKVGSTLYRPIMENDSIAAEKRYTVTSVTPPDPERYYLSIFTKADPNATKVYHYELYSPDSFDSSYMDDATKWRANKINDSKNTAMHLFTGDLYDNDLALKVESRTKQSQMSSDNDFLTITMTANIRLTDTAKAAENNINGNMDTFKDNAEIYQTFLMMYDKLETVGGTSEVGIDLEAGSDPVGSIKYYYKPGVISGQLENVNLIPDNENDYGATKITGYDKIVSDKYVELRNNLSGNQNLIDLLSDDSNNNAVTIQTKFDMVYAASELVYQFPKRDESAEGELGSSVIGYSRIASTKESAAYSATSQKAEDDTRYYTADESTAKLTYNVVESPITDPVGPFSSLGINSVETANPYSSFVDTIAVYDISKLKNPGEYVELTFSLSKRSNYNSALPIESYLDGVTIYGSDQDSDGTEDVIFLQTADSVTTGDNRRTNKGTTEYKVRVKKNLLKTQPGGAFIIPIHFNVKTGDSLFNSQTGGLEYSNYKVTITAKMYSTIDGNDPLAVSQASDHIIYTNARVVPSVIE